MQDKYYAPCKVIPDNFYAPWKVIPVNFASGFQGYVRTVTLDAECPTRFVTKYWSIPSNRDTKKRMLLEVQQLPLVRMV